MCLISHSNQHIIHIQQQICEIIIVQLEINTIVILTSGVVGLDHKRDEPLVPLPGRLLQPIKGHLEKTPYFLDLPERILQVALCISSPLNHHAKNDVFTSRRSIHDCQQEPNRCMLDYSGENLIVLNTLLLRIPFGN